MGTPGWGADAAVGVTQALAVLLVHLGGKDRQRASGTWLSPVPTASQASSVSSHSGPSFLHLYQWFLILSLVCQIFNEHLLCARPGLGARDGTEQSRHKALAFRADVLGGGDTV